MRDLDPFPSLGADCFRLAFQLLGDQAIDERDILQPAAVIALKKIAQDDAAGLFVGSRGR